MKYLVTIAALLACGAPPKDSAETPTVASGQLGLVRQVSWPGGGTEITIKISTPTGDPLGSAEIGAFRVSVDGAIVGEDSMAVTPQALPVGFTALLVRPAETQELRANQIVLLKGFLQERSSEERIGLFLWRERVEQLANFTRDRDRLDGQLDKLVGMEPSAEVQDAHEALIDVENRLFAVEGRGPRGMRAVVVEGADVPTLPATRAAVAVGVAGASNRLEEFASSSYFRVSVCGGLAGGNAELAVVGLEGVLPLGLAPALPESATDACDVTQMGPGLRGYPESIELVFTDAERGVYDQRVSSLSKSDFDLSVRLDGGAQIAASAHLRGKGTLGCERKSYTLTLAGPSRHLLPASRTDEFYLLSMCADDRYVQQYTANQLMKELGLYPLEFRYIEVVLDGQNQGVYLLLEKPREELVRDGSGVHSVMRRRFISSPPEEFFESKFDTGEFDAETMYGAASSDKTSLAEQIDLEQYLHFLALMTAYQNGDYIDEIWVVASEQRLADDTASLWFETMAWDNDDLFSECHYTGRFAFVDENELVYCAEAAIDSALLSDPILYSRYVDVLESVLEEHVTPDRFDAAVDATEVAIMPILSKAGVSAAMVRLIADNPGAIDPEEAKRDVAAKLESLRSQYRQRHSLLLDRISAYRGTLQ